MPMLNSSKRSFFKPLHVTLQYIPRTSSGMDYCPVTAISTVVVRDGRLFKKPNLMAYALKRPKFSKEIGVRLGVFNDPKFEVDFTDVSHDNGSSWRRLDTAHDLGRMVNQVIERHKLTTEFPPASTIPFPTIYAVTDHDVMDYVNPEAIRALIYGIADGELPAIEDEVAASDGLYTSMVNAAGVGYYHVIPVAGKPFDRDFHQGAVLRFDVPVEVKKGDVVAHIIPRGARWIIDAMPTEEYERLASLVRADCIKDINGANAFPLHLLSSVPDDAQAMVKNRLECFHFACYPTQLLRHTGLLQFNLLHNHMDRWIPAVATPVWGETLGALLPRAAS